MNVTANDKFRVWIDNWCQTQTQMLANTHDRVVRLVLKHTPINDSLSLTIIATLTQ